MMPAKKRTDQTKRTSSTSPTASTSHASGDQHHRLRHTGPSISTRSSTAASSKPPPTPAHPAQSTSESTTTQKGSHEKKQLAEISPRSSFTKFLYVLLFVVLLLFGWYLYGMITLLDKLKEEVGWWGIISGSSGGQMRWGTSEGWAFGSDRSGGEGGALELSLNAFASALGIPPMQIASAVKPLIPQATRTSIASQPGATDGSDAVRILFEDTHRNDGNGADATQIVKEFAEKMGPEEHVAESDAMV